MSHVRSDKSHDVSDAKEGSENASHWTRARHLADASVGIVLSILVLGCREVGPVYHLPQVAAPPVYKASMPPLGSAGIVWKPASSVSGENHADWWKAFGDSQLNSLEQQVDAANLQLRSAEAHHRAALEMLRVARAAYSPTAAVLVGSGYHQDSQTAVSPPSVLRGNDLSFTVAATWEPDLWGRIHRSVEASTAAVQASSADVAAEKLSLEAQLASAYMDLRGLESQADLLNATLKVLRSQVEITERRHREGLTSEVDVADAEAELLATEALSVDLDQARSQYVEAIAVLTGQLPEKFSLKTMALDAEQLPEIPPTLPSDLLERRPDIAAAERHAAEANAQVGVAMSAFYPEITLGTVPTGTGFDSKSITSLFQGPSAVWSLGADAAQLLFDGGRRRAYVAAARDNFDSAADDYKQTVLAGFAEVENTLASLNVLSAETRFQKNAVVHAARARDLSDTRYKAGATTYLEVLTAERTLLQDQRIEAALITRRYEGTVALLKALGGGWNRSLLP